VKYTPPGESMAITFEHDVGSSHPSYSVGDAVTVLYSPDDYNEAIIEAGLMNWFGPILMIFLGSIFVLVSGTLIRSVMKRKATTEEQLELEI
jgi:hypothetical protein